MAVQVLEDAQLPPDEDAAGRWVGEAAGKGMSHPHPQLQRLAPRCIVWTTPSPHAPAPGKRQDGLLVGLPRLIQHDGRRGLGVRPLEPRQELGTDVSAGGGSGGAVSVAAAAAAAGAAPIPWLIHGCRQAGGGCRGPEAAPGAGAAGRWRPQRGLHTTTNPKSASARYANCLRADSNTGNFQSSGEGDWRAERRLKTKGTASLLRRDATRQMPGTPAASGKPPPPPGRRRDQPPPLPTPTRGGAG